MESGEPEFQIAPMIDCLLVLLIFFMSITTAEVLQIDEDIKLPVAKDAKKKEKSKAEYALNVKFKNGKGVFNFMEKNYEDASLMASQLMKLKDNVPNCRLIIRADKNLPAVEIQRTMGVLASAGFDTITFSTLNQEGP